MVINPKKLMAVTIATVMTILAAAAPYEKPGFEPSHEDIAPLSQLLVPHAIAHSINGVTTVLFDTVGAGNGNRLNVHFVNMSDAVATIQVERNFGAGQWVGVAGGQRQVAANETVTWQIPSIVLFAPHRVRVIGASGANISGELGVRQTSQPLE